MRGFELDPIDWNYPYRLMGLRIVASVLEPHRLGEDEAAALRLLEHVLARYPRAFEVVLLADGPQTLASIGRGLPVARRRESPLLLAPGRGSSSRRSLARTLHPAVSTNPTTRDRNHRMDLVDHLDGPPSFHGLVGPSCSLADSRNSEALVEAESEGSLSRHDQPSVVSFK